jgi:glycerol-3-phosphate dehydrogenase
MSKKIVILGDGAWGTALALVLERGGHSIALWSKFPDYASQMREKRENVKFLPGVPLPGAIEIATGPRLRGTSTSRRSRRNSSVRPSRSSRGRCRRRR